jgi:hypothetical protein
VRQGRFSNRHERQWTVSGSNSSRRRRSRSDRPSVPPVGAIDRLDLIDNGVLMTGEDRRAIGDVRSTLAEVIAETAEFLAHLLTQRRGTEQLIAAGPRVLTKNVLFPVRFLYTHATGAPAPTRTQFRSVPRGGRTPSSLMRRFAGDMATSIRSSPVGYFDATSIGSTRSAAPSAGGSRRPYLERSGLRFASTTSG